MELATTNVEGRTIRRTLLKPLASLVVALSASALMAVMVLANVTPDHNSHNFGNVTVGNSASDFYIITNNGPGSVTYSGDSSPNGFSVSTNCGIGPVSQGSGCNVQITFSPPAPGNYGGNVVLNFVDSAGSPQSCSIQVSGTGVAAPPPSVPGFLWVGIVPFLGGAGVFTALLLRRRSGRAAN
jgi:hypothetical protein